MSANPRRQRPSIVYALVVVPLTRLKDLGVDIAGLVLGAAGYLSGAPLVSILLFLVVMSLWDHRLGREVARRGIGGKRFDPIVSQAGWLSKMSNIGYVLALRWLEAILASNGVWSKPGLLAFVLALILSLTEFESIDRNHELLRGKPTSLRPFLRFLRKLADRLMPVPDEGR